MKKQRIVKMSCTSFFFLALTWLSLWCLSLGTGMAEAASASCGGWSIVSSPNPSTSATLNAVAAISSSSIWSVGHYTNSSGVGQTLIERFNGSSWSAVSSPSPGSSGNNLGAVARIPATNQLWAVGIYVDSQHVGHSLIERFNGSSWNLVASPNLAANDYLSGVVAISTSNAYAVGSYVNSFGSRQTLIEHFNGNRWSVVASPNAGSRPNYLNGVAAVSASNIYAVGSYYNSSYVRQTLIERFNGSSWSIVTSPNATGDNALDGVAVVSASNIWAVGPAPASATGTPALIVHFNGSSWSLVPSAILKGTINLYSVAAVSASNIYAVGEASIPTAGAYPAQIEHFDGSTWSSVSTPNVGPWPNILRGVTRIPGTSELSSVGEYRNNTGNSQTLTEFYC